MQSQAAQPNFQSDSEEWSDRILIAALAGMLFLTCFPFRFISHARLPDGVSPFFLGVTFGKHMGVFDDFLNVLLFVPFGFGLSEKLFEKGKSRTTTFLVVWISGFFLSYAIELTQLYIPGRDSGWEDVLTNSTGSAVGFFLFIILGSTLLRLFTRAEQAIESIASIRWLAIVLLIYFSCWFAVSARLQAETRLTNWLPDSRLLIGTDVTKLEFWDRALSPQVASALTRGAISQAGAPAALAAYDFTGSPPFRDRMKFLPDLAWSGGMQAQGDPNQLVLNGGAWLASVAPVSGLVTDLQRTNQFAIHIVCRPAEGNWPDSRIISISRSPYLANLNVWQEDLISPSGSAARFPRGARKLPSTSRRLSHRIDCETSCIPTMVRICRSTSTGRVRGFLIDWGRERVSRVSSGGSDQRSSTATATSTTRWCFFRPESRSESS